jgi:FkbM family methyltransferase
MSNVLYKRCLSAGFKPRHVAEVGVYLPETSNILDFIRDNIPTTLVEADPVYVEKIKAYFKDYQQITLHPVAIFEKEGTIALYKRNASTFVGEVAASPALINDQYETSESDKFYVPAKTFDQVDDGTMDLLSIDIEGCEWYVIKNMKSRPTVLSVETHGKYYTNPFLKEILQWAETNGYEPWYKDYSDTVFVLKGSIAVSALDKVNLWFRDRYHAYLQIKGSLLGRKTT